MHIPGYGNGPPPEFDYENLKGEKYYDARIFYKNSKLANVWFAYELQRRLVNTGVTSNAVCPGFVPEAIGEKRTSVIQRFFYKRIMTKMPFARSLDQASDSYVAVATDPQFDGVGGKFIVDGEAIPSSDESYDEEKAVRLWQSSMVWCGMVDPVPG